MPATNLATAGAAGTGAAALGFARSLLMYYGRPWQTGRIARHYAAFLEPGDLAFDIGAHVGNRSRCWSRLGARVIAVEPQPRFARWLRWQFRDDARVTVIEQAIGAGAGTATLLASTRTPTVTTLSASWVASVRQDDGFAQVAWDQRVQVPVTTLDALIERFGRPRFCKIDVEGFEAEVLAGLSEPLPALSFEFLPAALGVAEAALTRLGELGPYRFNLSLGEQLAFLWPDWRGADEVHAWLNSGQHQGRSGDIYARLAA